MMRWAAACLVICGSSAWAQPASSQPKDEVLLGPLYQDITAGLAIRPPRGAVLVTDRPDDTQTEPLLVGFEHRPRQWSLQVRRRSPPASKDLQTVLQELCSQLIREHPAAKVTPVEACTVGGRPAGWFSARYEILTKPWFAYHAAVEQQPGSVIHLILTGLRTPDAVEERVFTAVLDSVTFLRSAQAERILAEATQRGREWLQSLPGRSLAELLVKDSVYLLVLQPDSPEAPALEVGFVRVQEWPLPDAEPPAVRLHEEGWRFDPDGSTRWWKRVFTLHEDLSKERWETTTLTAVRPPDASPLQLAVHVERVVRVGGTLAVAYTPTPAGRTLANLALDLPGSYLSPALTRLLPRLIDRTQPKRLGFVVYDSATRCLQPYSLVGLGRETQSFAGRRREVLRFEEQQGLADTNIFWCDLDGRLVAFQTGPLRSVPSTLKYVQEVFGQRVTAAGKLLAQIQPPGEPAGAGPP